MRWIFLILSPQVTGATRCIDERKTGKRKRNIRLLSPVKVHLNDRYRSVGLQPPSLLHHDNNEILEILSPSGAYPLVTQFVRNCQGLWTSSVQASSILYNWRKIAVWRLSPFKFLSALPNALTWAENWGGGYASFFERGAGSPSNTMSSGPRPTTVPSGILINAAVCRNRHGPKIGGAPPPF